MPTLLSSTPVLPVDAIEPCLPFWERLGFTRSNEVPHGDGIGFVMLSHGPVEVMLQTRASIADDDAGLAAALGRDPAALFVRVEDLDSVIPLVGDAEVVLAERRTFYGSREIGVRTPGGHVVTFAQFG